MSHPCEQFINEARHLQDQIDEMTIKFGVLDRVLEEFFEARPDLREQFADHLDEAMQEARQVHYPQA